jgi:hypothetical protein
MRKSIMHGISTKETDKNGVEIFFETTKLKLPDGKIGYLYFDDGQLSAYFSDENGYCIVELEGVNNCNSHYLNDCEVIV